MREHALRMMIVFYSNNILFKNKYRIMKQAQPIFALSLHQRQSGSGTQIIIYVNIHTHTHIHIYAYIYIHTYNSYTYKHREGKMMIFKIETGY